MKTLLTGTFLRSLDEKLRMAIPKKIRDALGGELVVYIAPGTDGSLALYPSDSFTRLAEQLDRNSPTGKDVRAFSRLFYAQVQRVELDRQGRVRIPPELAPIADLRKEVILIGVRDHLELWDRERWETYFADKQDRYDELAESAFAPQAHSALSPKQLDESSEPSKPTHPR